MTYISDWDYYIDTLQEKVTSTFLDLGLINRAPVEEKSELVIVYLPLLNPNKDGLTTNEEAEKLYLIEDSLEEAYKKKFGALYAGRLTRDGSRDFFFYMKPGENYQEVVEEVLKKHEALGYTKYRLKHSCDAQWEFYTKVLYPNPYNLQVILDNRALSELIKAGDDLKKRREVWHYSYFESRESRENFIKEIEKQGFQVQEISYDKKESLPYGVFYTREDVIDGKSIQEVTHPLLELSLDQNGSYDGWESPVITD